MANFHVTKEFHDIGISFFFVFPLIFCMLWCVSDLMFYSNLGTLLYYIILWVSIAVFCCNYRFSKNQDLSNIFRQMISVHPIFLSFGFLYFGHFSCVILFPFFLSCPSCLAKCKQILRNIFITLSPKVTKNGMNKIFI